jgi:hypothetical protein
MYSHLDTTQNVGHQNLFGVEGFQTFSVSASNPFNPFGADVGVGELLSDVPTNTRSKTDFLRALIGARGQTLGWNWEITASVSRDWTGQDSPNLLTDSVALQNALNSSDPNTALNPFVNGPLVPSSLRNRYFPSLLVHASGGDDNLGVITSTPPRLTV